MNRPHQTHAHGPRQPAKTAVDILRKILVEERSKAFADRTVGGGLDAFLKAHRAELWPLLGHLGSYTRRAPAQRGEWARRAMVAIAEAGGAPGPRADRAPGSGRPPARTPPGGATQPPRRPPAATRGPRPGGAPPPQRPAVSAPPPPLSLADPVAKVTGVGEATADRLRRLGVSSVGDLLYHLPFRHSTFRRVSELVFGEDQTVMVSADNVRTRPVDASMKLTTAELSDATGTVQAMWFSRPRPNERPWIENVLSRAGGVVVSGKVGAFRTQLQFTTPDCRASRPEDDRLRPGMLLPVYPLTEGLVQDSLRRHVKQALDRALPSVVEFLPSGLRERGGLIGLPDAFSRAHYPSSLAEWNAARRRLAFDELFIIQLAVLARKRAWQSEGVGVPLAVEPAVVESIIAALPFRLTRAQREALGQVLDDLRRARPMSRLLQGDVGSGKTVVAVVALLVAALSGHQGVFMAPTEILAEQHFFSISRLLRDLSQTRTEHGLSLRVGPAARQVTVGVLVGSLSRRAKEAMQGEIAAGRVDIAIGTHALVQPAVEVPRLALAVVDEQQRFGVMHRASLRAKGDRPHLLAMSATPIPRSLALTFYGDLDVSTIGELPPGRRRVKTRLISPEGREAAYGFLREQVKSGRQAFIICPLIEESEAVRARAAAVEHERLSIEVFPDLRLQLLHGRMSLRDKEEAMERFQSGKADVLVSTAVVEVGVDVPNATVMLVESADRFGMAQLHQLRGRVGRGAHESHCLLLSESSSPESRERLKVLERVHDGFEIAEKDLELRGEGDHMGTRQSGLSDLKVARIGDGDIIALARREAERLLDADPDLSAEEHSPLRREVARYAVRAPGEVS